MAKRCTAGEATDFVVALSAGCYFAGGAIEIGPRLVVGDKKNKIENAKRHTAKVTNIRVEERRQAVWRCLNQEAGEHAITCGRFAFDNCERIHATALRSARGSAIHFVSCCVCASLLIFLEASGQKDPAAADHT